MDSWYVCRPHGWAPGAPVYGELYPTSSPYGGSASPYPGAPLLSGGGPPPYGPPAFNPNPGYNPDDK